MTDAHYAQVFVEYSPTTKIQWFVCAFTQSPAFHCGLGIGDGLVISAQPGGARIEPESRYPDSIWSRFELTDDQAHAAVEWAKQREGRPYNWLDDALIGIESVSRFRFPRWVSRRWVNDKSYQCAQLCDAAYARGAGIVLFDDGRHPGRVSPGSFAELFRARGWWPTGRWAGLVNKDHSASMH